MLEIVFVTTAALAYAPGVAQAVSIWREWGARRAARRLTDERLAAFHALPPEDQLGYVHPASPQKPPGWTIEKHRETQRRRDGSH